MSLPVTLAALPTVVVSCAPTADSGAPSVAPDCSFSRVLAGQRRASAAPAQNQRANIAPTDTAAPATGKPADVALIKANVADNEDDQNDTLAVEPDDQTPPDAPLAALTLDIATQTTAQLRGAQLRARTTEAGQAAASTARGLTQYRPSAAPGQTHRLEDTPRLHSDAPTTDHNGVLARRLAQRPQTTTAPPAPTPHTDKSATSVAAALATTAPATHFAEHATLARLAPEQALPRTTATKTDERSTTEPNDLSGLTAPQSASPESRATTTMPTRTMPGTPTLLHIDTPVGATHWGSALGRQLVTLGRQAADGTQTAELRLDPPELGPLRVTLIVNEGVANASFSSAHASVRQAVEAAMSQLQSALAQSGLSLGQASVSDQQAPDQFAFAQPGRAARVPTPDDAPPVEPPAATKTPRGNALVDTFV